MLRTLSLLLSAALLLGCNKQDTRRPIDAGRPASSPTSTTVDKDPMSEDADNTARNVRDRNAAAKTPIDQNENQTDVNLTADIRARILDAKLSINAQNVKVITQDRHVTLRGPVDSAAEKERIENIVKTVAGDHFDSHLEVIGNR